MFVAELGDKTQLATFLFAADRPAAKLTVLAGASLAAMDALRPVPRFGASDCRCDSHLFHCSAEPGARLFERILEGEIRCQDAPN